MIATEPAQWGEGTNQIVGAAVVVLVLLLICTEGRARWMVVLSAAAMFAAGVVVRSGQYVAAP